MAKPKVLATRPLFAAAREILNADCEVDYWTKRERISKSELFRRIKDKQGLVCLLTEKVNEELLRAAPKLRIAANVAVGYDNITVADCTRRGVAATNTPGVLDETTADFAWTLLMAVARRLGEGEQLARSGKWKGWDLDQLVGTDVWGKTLGLVGFGRIGQAGMFNAKTLSQMKPSAFLINTSRGPVVDEAALVQALKRKKIAGAALDVFEREPLIHAGLKRPNVVLAPHIASASLETRTKMACMAAQNVVALFKEQRPPNILNPEVLKAN